MIKEFNDVEVRDSACIYRSTFEQIKQMYAVDAGKAGELAIAAIEVMLTGQHSSDDFYVNLILQDMLVVSDQNKFKYEYNTKRDIEKNKLVKIQTLLEQGYTQKEIGEKLGLSQQTVSYRIKNMIPKYLYTLQKIQKIQSNDNDNVNDNENVNEDVNENVFVSGAIAPPTKHQATTTFTF